MSRGAVYKSFLQREGPQNLGAVSWPEAKSQALSGKKFLVTGVLDTIERDEFIKLIKESGGHVMSGMSKNLDYLIVGRDAGPAKLKKAEEFGLKQMDENETFNMFERILSEGHSLEDEEPSTSTQKKTETKKKETKKKKSSKRKEESDEDDDEVEESPKKKKATAKKTSKKTVKKSEEEVEEDGEDDDLGNF